MNRKKKPTEKAKMSMGQVVCRLVRDAKPIYGWLLLGALLGGVFGLISFWECFGKSAFGVVGIETAFPILYTYLVKPGILTMEKLLELLVDNPRKRFGLSLGCDYSVWDLEAEETVNPDSFLSLGKATPFEGWKVSGKCLATVCDGKVVYRAK